MTSNNKCNTYSTKIKFCDKCDSDFKCPRFEKCNLEKNPPNVAGKWRYYETEVQHNGMDPKDWGSIYKPVSNTSEFELIQNGVFVQTKPSPLLTRPPELSVWEKIRDYRGNFISWQLNTIDTNFDNDYLRYNYVQTDCYNNAISLEGIKLETGFTRNDPAQTPEVAIIRIVRI